MKFECVGRLGSVTGAASELGTSAASLSRGMRSLERQLSAQLLKRHGNGVRLTEAGRRYHRGVIAALNRLHASAEAATQLSQGTSLVIACSLDDSHLLLIPRYGDLERVLGEETRIRLLTYHRSERELRPVDMADIVLSWRTADAVRRQHAVLVTEAIQPVCSPAYLAAHKRICKDPARVGAA
ncbi:MAG: LysR family transcriptional regulator [Rhodospirillaceae bacterium]|nr:LysR family transcriptional regulator [Rhodospirillaceae bacterium]